MDKKLIIICAAIILLAAAFIYMSFSPNTATIPASPIAGDTDSTKKVGLPPPPPPARARARSATAPPPPPTGLRKTVKKAAELPEGYINYEVLSRPEPILKLKKGSTTQVTLDVKKGSEDFTIEWFKKEKSSLKKVNIGNTFSVSPEDNVVYYMATIDDKVNEPENIFFQVEPELTDTTEPAQTAETPVAQLKKVAPVPVAAPTPEPKEPVEVSQPAQAEEVVQAEEVAQAEPIQQEPIKKEKFVITATKNTDIVARAGTPLNISFNVESDESYKIFWFHKPFGKKKGSLIKKRKKLNFSLKRLNKYHSGYFYIQIKDSLGKFYKSPDYKVTVK